MGLIGTVSIAALAVTCLVTVRADDDDVKKVAVLLNEEDARASRKSTFGTKYCLNIY